MNILGLSIQGGRRLVNRIDPDGRPISYTYDLVGNRTSVTTPAGRVDYQYDAYHRLDKVIDSGGNLTDYDYDGVNNLVRTTMANGVVETRDYNPMNWLTQLEQVGSTGTIARYQYTLDEVGNRTQIEEANGRVINYDYDALYRVTQEEIVDPLTGSRTTNYVYDPIGNRLSRHDSSEGETSYLYDGNDRLLSETLNGQTTVYSYDQNGNTLSKSSLSEQINYTWNQENRLVTAQTTTSTGTTTSEYSYNGDGIRVMSRSNGQETRYLVDGNRDYAQVLEEYNNSGVQVSYVYGHNLISQHRSGVNSYYLTDGLGSTRALTNQVGEVTDTYDYDAYGNLLGSTGTTVNNYLYTGEQFDSNLGQYYLRARYYDSNLGRFTGRDSFEGFMDEPLSLAKYPYVHGNPVNATDPSGLFTLTETTGVRVGNDAVLSTQSATVGLRALFRSTTSVLPGGYTGSAGTLGLRSALNLQVGRNLLEFLSAAVASELINRSFSFPVIVWGNDLPDISLHTRWAQNGISSPGAVNVGNKLYKEGFKDGIGRASPFLARVTPQGRGWIDKYLPARGKLNIPGVSRVERDEYSYASSFPGGEGSYLMHLVSLKYVPNNQNSSQGTKLERFYDKAPVVKLDPNRMFFGVLTTTSDITHWIDREGRIRYDF